jgi:hypothetical protein
LQDSQKIAENLREIGEMIVGIVGIRDDFSNIYGIFEEVKSKIEEVDWRINQDIEERNRRMIECLEEVVEPFRVKPYEVLSRLDDGEGKKEADAAEEEERIIQRMEVSTKNDDKIDVREMSELFMELGNGPEFLGRLEECKILVDNRRIG